MSSDPRPNNNHRKATNVGCVGNQGTVCLRAHARLKPNLSFKGRFDLRNQDDANDGSPYHGYVVRRAEDTPEDTPDMDTAGEGEFEVLLHTQATCHLIRDRALLRNIQELARPVQFNGTGGTSSVRYTGFMPYFGRVYHDPNAPVNILAFSVVEIHTSWNTNQGLT